MPIAVFPRRLVDQRKFPHRQENTPTMADLDLTELDTDELLALQQRIHDELAGRPSTMLGSSVFWVTVNTEQDSLEYIDEVAKRYGTVTEWVREGPVLSLKFASAGDATNFADDQDGHLVAPNIRGEWIVVSHVGEDEIRDAIDKLERFGRLAKWGYRRGTLYARYKDPLDERDAIRDLRGKLGIRRQKLA